MIRSPRSGSPDGTARVRVSPAPEHAASASAIKTMPVAPVPFIQT
ncbi:hypothetical protein [Brevundimonas denitrificans]|nr:hypothetical protein [Brevundimonas denitrificans]